MPVLTYTHLDLFAGLGGFSLAAKWLGWQTIGFVEKDEYCQKVLRKNFGQDVKIVADIHDVSADTFRQPDIITGGFPCQPFSIAGKKQGNKDDRALWSEMFRVIENYKPRLVVGENVANFVTMELDNCLLDLENAGYETVSFVLPACAVGAPHRRDRVWILANAASTRCQTRQSNAMGTQQNEGTAAFAHSFSKREHWRQVATRICRMADGLSERLDRNKRLKALGNSIVPQVAYEILSAIQDVDCQRARA